MEGQDVQNRFFTSDTHFSHARIIELCNRPFADYEEMNEALVENWNHVVDEDDIVYHLGDVALGPQSSWDGVLSRLNGHKILIAGNHDRVSSLGKTSYIAKWMPEYMKWFEGVYQSETITLADGTLVDMSHYPYDGDSHDEDRYAGERLVDKGRPLIHGHTHGADAISFSDKGTIQIHVGMDAHNYTPVSEQQVIDYIRLASDLSKSYLNT